MSASSKGFTNRLNSLAPAERPNLPLLFQQMLTLNRSDRVQLVSAFSEYIKAE
jgi:hypothetical protein